MQAKALQSLRGRLLQQASLAEYNAWRVGGVADLLFIPADTDDLVVFLQQLPEHVPLTWLGLGSNVLIRDGGIEGAVIVTQGGLDKISQVDKECVRAEAGVACGQLARYTARLNLSGLEFMAGIPGTVGGALAMNAGCYGGETWQFVYQTETMNRSGERKLRSATDYVVSYRSARGLSTEWFIAGYFKLMLGEKTHSLNQIRVLLEKRNAAQPTGLPNCGSVFRNPPGDYAGRLIELCGLKGMTVGGARVSEKHANFIINEGNATAADIETLIQQVATRVEQQCQVSLFPEVAILGRAVSAR